MKRRITTATLVITTMFLMKCANMVGEGVNKDRTGKRTIIGETGLYRGTENCPNGGVLTLALESNAGVVEVISRGVISSTPIEDNYDVYEIAKFRHTGFDPDHDYSKVSISPIYKDFTIIFSGQEAASADGKTMQTVGLNEPFSMVLKGNVLELPGSSEGVKTSFSLSESKKIGDNGVAKTLKISADGKDFQTFPLPTPILGEKVPSFGIVSAVAKGAMTFNIEPATDGSILYVQWNNQKKHENGQTYETVIQEIPADGKIEIPVEDTAAGTYKLYVSRIKLGEATLGDAKICVDAGATVVSQLKVSEEESK